ncbi:MAG: tetratricopeptide repeat protein [Planctomycetota bacterium]
MRKIFFLGYSFFYLLLVQCASSSDPFSENRVNENGTSNSSQSSQLTETKNTLIPSGICPRDLQYQGKYRSSEKEWALLQGLNILFQEKACAKVAERLGWFPQSQEHFVIQLLDGVTTLPKNTVEIRKEEEQTYLYLTFAPEPWIRHEREPIPDLSAGLIKGFLLLKALQHKLPKFLQEALIFYGSDQGDSLTRSTLSQILVPGQNVTDVFSTDLEASSPLQNFLFLAYFKESYGVAGIKRFVEGLETEESWEKSFASVSSLNLNEYLDKLKQFQQNYLLSQVRDINSLYEFRVALKHLLEQRYSDSAQLFQTLILKYPFPYIQGDATYRLGLSYYFQERFLEASEKFKEVLFRYPATTAHLGDATFLSALCALKLKQQETALTQLDGFLRNFPDSSKWGTSWFWKGMLYVEQHQENLAEPCFQEVLKLSEHPKRRESLEQLAQIKKNQGKLQATSTYYQLLAQENPDWSPPAIDSGTPLSDAEKKQIVSLLPSVEKPEIRTQLIEIGRRVLPILAEYLVSAPLSKKNAVLEVLEGISLSTEEVAFLWKILLQLPVDYQDKLFHQLLITHKVPLKKLQEMIHLLAEPLRSHFQELTKNLLLDADPLLLEHLPDLLSLLNSNQSLNRIKGIQQIIQLGAIEGVPVLAHFLTDKEEEVQQSALHALAILGAVPPSLIPRLTPFLHSSKSKLIIASLRVFHALGNVPESISKEMLPLIQHPDLEVVLQVIKTIANQKTVAGLLAIYPLLNHPSPEVVSLVEDVFNTLPDTMIVPLLIQGLQQTDQTHLIWKTSLLLQKRTRVIEALPEKEVQAEQVKSYWLAWWNKNRSRYPNR